MLNNIIKKENNKILNNEVSKISYGVDENHLENYFIIDDIAKLHKVTVKHLNESIRKNMSKFNSNDCIDLFKIDLNFSMEYLNEINKNKGIRKSRRTDLFMLNQSGYLTLLTIMRNDSVKKEVMNVVLDNYMIMKEQLNNVVKLDPNTFIESLPGMCKTTLGRYLKSILTPNNIQDIVPAIIQKIRETDNQISSDGHYGLPARKKTELLSEVSNTIKHLMEDNKDTYMGFDREKMLYYSHQVKDYKDIVKTASLAGITKRYNDAKEELKSTKEELEKVIDEKSVIEKPIVNDQNKYEDLLRSFKVYRNYLAKVWDMGMEEVCNDYYDLIPVKLPMATECHKLGYQSKFEYCYAYYPEDTKIMVNKMYKDCVANGYLERKK